ncbi:MAG: GreA/GreB family elongation factor [Flavobacteriia bacterium]|nr:GreA/GreB family elongation factor [Flavobacteriia bacterium]
MDPVKEAVFKHCQEFLLNKVAAYQAGDQSLLVALDSEGKSSAGDKHETGRAMIQLEREKLAQQRQLNEAAFQRLSALKNKKPSALIGPGSLVKTSLATYYLAVPADPFAYDGQPIYCISPQSPIAQILLGKRSGDSFTFRDSDHEILEVL